MRIVPDTNFLIRCHDRHDTLAKRLLKAMADGGHQMVSSNEILSEVVRVLRYPAVQRMYEMNDAEIFLFSQSLRHISEIVPLDPLFIAPMRDPSDLIVLQTAERGRANAICTADRDFSSPEVINYCASLGIEIVDEQTLASRLL